MKQPLNSPARLGEQGDTSSSGAPAGGRRPRSLPIAAIAAILAAASMLAFAPLAGAAKLGQRPASAHTSTLKRSTHTHATRAASRHQRALQRARRLAAARARLRAARSGHSQMFVSKALVARLERENVPNNAPESSQGTDFWLTFESNCLPSLCGDPSGDNGLFLFISGTSATTGTVTAPDDSYSQGFSVTPGVATVIQLPGPVEDDVSDQIAQDAVHVTAGSAVSVYGLNTYTATTDGFTGLPTNILGTNYLVEGYGAGGGSQFAIVGTQAGTTVTITPSESINSYTAGTPYQITLNQGDVYQLIDETGFGSGGDLSGTSITSSAPVAVFAGNDCADVPVSDFACNTLAEEMTPTDTWGTGFYTEPLATRSGDTFRFMASEENTTVDVDGAPVATLNTGQFFETILTAASVITANNPIQVMQYSNGEGYDGANADPFDITIPPYAQYENSYTISTEPSGADPSITNNYINVVAPTSEIGAINLDGSLVPSSDFTQIGTSDYSGAQLSVGFGSHTLSAPLPFGITVYGYGGYDGYGYPGGFTLSPIAVVNSISLSASPSTQVVGDQACATATVEDQNGNPVDGVNVEFTITGANPQVGFAYTDSSGQAQYCWTGTDVGLDTVTASVQTINSNTQTVDWTQASTSVTTSLSFGSQSGADISVPQGTPVTDQAAIGGSDAAVATGTVTYSVYSDANCTDAVSGPDQESITTAGTAPGSQAVTLNSPGTYYWQAVYSGDSNNAGSSSTCGSEIETVTGVGPTGTQITTSLTGGGGSGGSITVAPGTSVVDSSLLSGSNAGSATGSVTYSVYSDANCSQLVSGPDQESITTAGSMPDSQAVLLSSPGTYYWQATYSGDSANAGSSSACGSEVETVSQPVSPEPTSLSTSILAGNGAFGPAGTPLSDQASLAGANVASASGTVTYDLWSDADCTVPAVASQTVSVSDGVVPASSPVVLPEGLYYYTVSYSGDALNDPSYSGCRNEGYVVLGSARFGADVGVQIELQPASPESAGSDFTVCVTVTNFGPKAAKNIVAGLLLGKGLTVVDPAGATVFGRLLIWKPGTFYAGESSTYSVTVEATKSGTATVTDGALSLGTIDPNYHNNFASEGLTINGADHVVGHAIRDRAGSVFLARLRAVGRELAKRSR